MANQNWLPVELVILVEVKKKLNFVQLTEVNKSEELIRQSQLYSGFSHLIHIQSSQHDKSTAMSPNIEKTTTQDALILCQSSAKPKIKPRQSKAKQEEFKIYIKLRAGLCEGFKVELVAD